MQIKTLKRFFPSHEAVLVNQDGSKLTEPSEGITIVLYTRENELNPCCAELISGEIYAEIGLSFEGKRLSDYDGVFWLPLEVGQILKDVGYVVPENCFA